ncbi:MAG TPA: DUF3109 family protein [Bacteroidales bacterium]|nr:DUF3109 family protein [Bacteroidales bacterium]
MFVVDETIVSDDFAIHCFKCDINKCKGACCIHGDAGAPLNKEELPILEKILPEVEPFLTKQGKEAIKKYGAWVQISDDEYVTPLAESSECAYVYFSDNNIAMCAIEKAWSFRLIEFRKPISCHLYPARITQFKNFIAINYHQWSICQEAVINGESKDIKLYEFLKEPFIRKFGINWYNKLLSSIRKRK